MKLTVMIEDTYNGINAVVSSEPNGITDHREQSLSYIVVGNWATQLRNLALCRAVVIEGVTTDTATR